MFVYYCYLQTFLKLCKLFLKKSAWKAKKTEVWSAVDNGKEVTEQNAV